MGFCRTIASKKEPPLRHLAGRQGGSVPLGILNDVPVVQDVPLHAAGNVDRRAVGKVEGFPIFILVAEHGFRREKTEGVDPQGFPHLVLDFREELKGFDDFRHSLREAQGFFQSRIRPAVNPGREVASEIDGNPVRFLMIQSAAKAFSRGHFILSP